MKVTYHIPTEQYGFVEVEHDCEKDIGKIEDLKLSDYETVKALVSPETGVGQAEGLVNKEWLKVVEDYLNNGELTGGAETWIKLNKYQQDWIQETKRALKRLKAHEE